jgi:hypothetical protein
MPIYPINLSINKSKVIKNVCYKKKLLASLIPGDISTYIYDNEIDYYNEYKESYFAITQKKGGWDCMRHYEILANGCIPLFLDIEACPYKTMYNFPKETILNTNLIYNNIISLPDDSQLKTAEEMELTKLYIKPLLEYSRNYLTNEKTAEYILNVTNNNNVKKILFLSGCTNPDYLRCTVLVGFKELFGVNCHDYPKIQHIYKGYENADKLYGKGISYTRLIDDNERNNNYDNTIEQDIKNKIYDVVIYGSYYRGIPFWELVNQNYGKDKIIMLWGEDIMEDKYCNYEKYSKEGYQLFVREL